MAKRANRATRGSRKTGSGNELATRQKAEQGPQKVLPVGAFLSQEAPAFGIMLLPDMGWPSPLLKRFMRAFERDDDASVSEIYDELAANGTPMFDAVFAKMDRNGQTEHVDVFDLPERFGAPTIFSWLIRKGIYERNPSAGKALGNLCLLIEENDLSSEHDSRLVDGLRKALAPETKIAAQEIIDHPSMAAYNLSLGSRCAKLLQQFAAERLAICEKEEIFEFLAKAESCDESPDRRPISL